MSGLGLICLVTSCFTNATCSYVGLWLVTYALCLMENVSLFAQQPATHHRVEARRLPRLPSFPNCNVHIPPPSGERVPICWKPVCTQAVFKEKTL